VSAEVWAILAAAGQGERMGEKRPKAFVRLGRRPLLAESLERLDLSTWVDGIVVAAPPGWEEPVILLAEEIGCERLSVTVAGGATRTDSVRAALAEVPAGAAVVVVHDAARPLVDDQILERVLTAVAEGWDGAVPALPLVDTVKRVEGEQVVETLDRSALMAIQTPQAFAAGVLRAAYADEAATATDCASLVEARGGRIRIVQGDPRLLKITTAADLQLVESWLAT
jgi:2-C-methyl-D-erythritol 4-phosphate cytidylyltransferase